MVHGVVRCDRALNSKNNGQHHCVGTNLNHPWIRSRPIFTCISMYLRLTLLPSLSHNNDHCERIEEQKKSCINSPFLSNVIVPIWTISLPQHQYFHNMIVCTVEDPDRFHIAIYFGQYEYIPIASLDNRLTNLWLISNSHKVQIFIVPTTRDSISTTSTITNRN
jgi:hypothetical protein